MPRVKAVFPTEDYPVWTSLATGLYPEEHNVIGDVMFNLRTREFFNRSDVGSTRTGDWWKRVEPFWSTAAQHGRKARGEFIGKRSLFTFFNFCNFGLTKKYTPVLNF